ncbi:uncharacterized protein O3C94_018968 [Discoglossus pictus]
MTWRACDSTCMPGQEGVEVGAEAVYRIQTPVHASPLSPPLPKDILLEVRFEVQPKPIDLSYLRLLWERDGVGPVVEFKDEKLIVHNPRATVSVYELKTGNASLTLTNLALTDTGNYTCVLHYGTTSESAHFALIVEAHRIRVIPMTPKEQPDGVPESAANLHLLQRTTLKPPHPPQISTRGHPFLSVAVLSPVRAQVGGDVTLPCYFKVQPPIRLAKLSLQWFKEGRIVMFLNKSYVYPPHLPFPEETLLQGNAHLELKDVNREDSGIYQCFIQYDSMRNHKTVSLIIQGDQDLEALAVNVPHTASSPYRELKIGMVVSVLGISGCLVIVLFCFYAG